eukprot:2341850-Amphidinium_carterae.1
MMHQTTQTHCDEPVPLPTSVIFRPPGVPFGAPRHDLPLSHPDFRPRLEHLLPPLFLSPVRGGALKRSLDPQTHPSLHVIFNPDSHLAPHCLFACLLVMCKVHPTLEAIRYLRKEIQIVYRDLLCRDEWIAGHPIMTWARQLNMTTRSFVEDLYAHGDETAVRQGNSIDAFVASMLLAQTVWIAAAPITSCDSAPPAFRPVT